MSIKCSVCINLRLNGKDMSTDQPVLEAEARANIAVVVAGSNSLCVAHYHTYLQNLSWQTFNKTVASK